MSGAIPPLPYYTFMAWCSVKEQGQLYLDLYLYVFNVLMRHEILVAKHGPELLQSPNSLDCL
jgi:hypothetical protein